MQAPKLSGNNPMISKEDIDAMNEPTPVTNTEGYAYFEGEPNSRPRHELKVTFILDMCQGAFHQPEDLMKWIAQNPYVDTVSYVK